MEADPLDSLVLERPGLAAGPDLFGAAGHPDLVAPGGLAPGELEEVTLRPPLELGGKIMCHMEKAHFSGNLRAERGLHLSGWIDAIKEPEDPRFFPVPTPGETK